MLNKKAFAPRFWIGIIVMTVVFIVLLKSTPLIARTIIGGAEDQICAWSAGISSAGKIGPKTISDLYCEGRIVHVMLDSDDIPLRERVKGVEYVYINKAISDDLRRKLATWYGEAETNFDIKNNEDRVLKYRLNEIMAKELKKCWGNLGSGTYDLFDQDLSPIGYEKGTFKKSDTLNTKLLKSLQLWRVELKKVPKVCKICSTIIFHSNVKSKFGGEEIDLKPFLLKNPVKRRIPETVSYYEFLEDDIKQTDFFRPEYRYTTDTTQAVAFLRMNMHSYIREIFGDLASLDLSQIVSDSDYKEGRILAVDVPLLIPFDEVNDNCDKHA